VSCSYYTAAYQEYLGQLTTDQEEFLGDAADGEDVKAYCVTNFPSRVK